MGRRLVTTQAFKKGAVVLKERPLLVVPMDLVSAGRKGQTSPSSQATETYDGLTPVQKRLLGTFETALDSLPEVAAAAVREEPGLRLARILAVNAHDFQKEPGKAALYVLVARANHSCDPVCGLDALPSGELILYALRDLEVGEEVLYSYLGGNFTLHTTPIRKTQLRQVKLFDCRCSQCVAPDAPEQWPCGTDSCDGFLSPGSDAGDQGDVALQCDACGAEEYVTSSRLESARRMAPMWSKKVSDLEAQWHNPSKDVVKYISDWETLAKNCGRMIGGRHHVYGRACFFALMALNTGRALGLGGVDADRHAAGVKLFGTALLRYLIACCPDGARRVSLEPLARAMLLLSTSPEHKALAVEIVQLASRDDLSLPLLGQRDTTRLVELMDAIDA